MNQIRYQVEIGNLVELPEYQKSRVVENLTRMNNFAGFGCRVYALFMFPRGRIKSKTIFPIGIAR